MENIVDLDFNSITKEEALKKYVKNIKKLQQAAEKTNINRETFQQYVLQQFRNDWTYKYLLFYKICSKFMLRHMSIYKIYFINMVLLFLTLITLQTYKNELYSNFIRQIQYYIYPFMRVIRKMAIPLLYLFPNLALFYDETCLVNNPYFQTNHIIDCRGCQHINIVDISSQPQLINVHNNFPFLLNVEKSSLTDQDLQSFFEQQKEKSESVQSLADSFLSFLNITHDKLNHTIWRCNTMQCTRVLRKLFPRPKQIPRELSISLTRYLIFDSKDWPAYKIPDGDCDLSFIQQVQGERKLVLQPNEECLDVCKKLIINLSEKQILFYNWWYYNAVSLPNIRSKAGISYVGSYC